MAGLDLMRSGGMRGDGVGLRTSCGDQFSASKVLSQCSLRLWMMPTRFYELPLLQLMHFKDLTMIDPPARFSFLGYSTERSYEPWSKLLIRGL